LGIISEEYIMKRLGEYAHSKAGKARIAKLRKDAFNGVGGKGAGFLTREDVEKTLAKITDKFISAVITVIPSFRFAGGRTVGQIDNEGRVRASIFVNEDSLRRESLHYVNKDLSIGRGDGVDDILALFTHGYTISGKRPYGFWVRDNLTAELGNPLTRIGALMHRDPNPFLTEFVNEMNIEYSGICEVTLNDKYTNRGGG
jgi:hypothetical protein